MVEHPVIAGVVLNNLGIVSGPDILPVAMDQHLEIVLQKWSALLVHIRSEKAVGTAHDSPVGTFDPFAARAHGPEEIILSAVFMDICSLECSSCHQLRLGTRLDREAVL